jgi:hypothetical protein
MDVNFISAECCMSDTSADWMGRGNASQTQTVGNMDCFMLDRQCQAQKWRVCYEILTFWMLPRSIIISATVSDRYRLFVCLEIFYSSRH